jgi:hypothetical protein
MHAALAQTRRRHLLDPVLWGILLPPFLFFGWMLWSGSTIGNDYPIFHVRSALSLRFYETLGLEPMWYPHLGGGIPIGGLILGQYFHLPAWLCSRMPGFWDGRALEWITARQLMLFVLLHTTAYRACRRLIAAGRATSYLLSFVFVYNTRTLDVFRYGPGLDVAVYAQCAVLLGLTYLVRPAPWRLALLAVATQLLLTGGYPVLIPLFLVATILATGLLLTSGAVTVGDARRRGLAVSAAAVAGTLLAAPAIAAISDFLRVNQTRVARPTLDWATAWSMPPRGPLQNALAPWTADVHMAYSGATLLALLLTALFVWTIADLRRRAVVLLIVAFPFLYALGSPSPVFRFFFFAVPGFASLRVPPRMLIVLPLLVLAVLAWARRGRPWNEVVGANDVRRALQWSGGVNAVALGATLVVVATGSALDALAAEMSPLHLTGFWSRPWQAVWLLLGITASAAFTRVPNRRAGGVLIVVTVLQSALVMTHGTWTSIKPAGATREAFATAEQLPLYGTLPFWAANELNEHAEASATIAYTRFVKAAGSQANCYLPIDPDRRKFGVLLPFYLSANWIPTTSREEALDRLKSEGGCRYDGSTKTLVTAPAAQGSEASGAELAALNARNRLLALQPNRVRLRVETPRDAVLVTPFPEATEYWSATVDSLSSPFVTVNGAFLGVSVPAGTHVIDVAYFSRRMQLGWRVFLAATIAFTVGAAWLAARRRRHAWILVALVTVVAVLGALRLDRAYGRRAAADILLPNGYADLLRRQLDRWRP